MVQKIVPGSCSTLGSGSVLGPGSITEYMYIKCKFIFSNSEYDPNRVELRRTPVLKTSETAYALGVLSSYTGALNDEFLVSQLHSIQSSASLHIKRNKVTIITSKFLNDYQKMAYRITGTGTY